MEKSSNLPNMEVKGCSLSRRSFLQGEVLTEREDGNIYGTNGKVEAERVFHILIVDFCRLAEPTEPHSDFVCQHRLYLVGAYRRQPRHLCVIFQRSPIIFLFGGRRSAWYQYGKSTAEFGTSISDSS